MDLSNLSDMAKQAVEAAKNGGADSLSGAKKALSEGIESLKDKVGGDGKDLSSVKEKVSDLLEKGSDALHGLADKLK